MYELIEELAEKIAIKYSFLDKDALLGKNPNIMYLDIKSGLLEIDRKTHISKCISKEEKVINLFNAIQTLIADL